MRTIDLFKYNMSSAVNKNPETHTDKKICEKYFGLDDLLSVMAELQQLLLKMTSCNLGLFNRNIVIQVLWLFV